MINISKNNNFKQIKQRMLSSAPTNLDKREGSVIYDMVAPTALELSNLYSMLAFVLTNSRLETVEDFEILILMAKELGLERRMATKAVVTAEFNIEIDPNSVFRLENSDLTYYVKRKTIYNEETQMHEYLLECSELGKVGNIDEGILLSEKNIEGLKIAKIKELTIVAENNETFEELKRRCLLLKRFPFSGNRTDYIRHIEFLDGVGRIKAHRRKLGEINVEVEIQAEDFGAASEELIQRIQEKIDPVLFSGEGIGEIGIDHRVLIKSVSTATINIATNLELESGVTFESIKDNITETINEYILEENQKWADVDSVIIRSSQVISRLLKIKGIKDVLEIKLNGLDRISLLGKIAKLGAITNV